LDVRRASVEAARDVALMTQRNEQDWRQSDRAQKRARKRFGTYRGTTRKTHKLSPRDEALLLRLAAAPVAILRAGEGRAGLV